MGYESTTPETNIVWGRFDHTYKAQKPGKTKSELLLLVLSLMAKDRESDYHIISIHLTLHVNAHT